MSAIANQITRGIPLDQLAGTWELDPAHSTVGFVTRYLKFSKVRGAFTRVSGEATVTGDPARSPARATIETASLDTGNEQRDGHLRSPDFFDVERFPTIEFEATGAEPLGEGRLRVHGDLTMHGVTRPIDLEAELLGTARDPFGREKAAFTAAARVNREDFGLTGNQALEAGGFLVGKEVDIEIDGQLIHRPS